MMGQQCCEWLVHLKFVFPREKDRIAVVRPVSTSHMVFVGRGGRRCFAVPSCPKWELHRNHPLR